MPYNNLSSLPCRSSDAYSLISEWRRLASNTLSLSLEEVDHPLFTRTPPSLSTLEHLLTLDPLCPGDCGCRYVQVPVQVVRQVEVVKEIPIEVVKEVERITEVYRDVPVEVVREQVPPCQSLAFPLPC